MINSETVSYPFAHTDLTMKAEYSTGNIIYLGYAAPGSAVTASAWQIRKYTYDGDDVTDVQFANGKNDYIHVWNGRAGYSYS